MTAGMVTTSVDLHVKNVIRVARLALINHGSFSAPYVMMVITCRVAHVKIAE